MRTGLQINDTHDLCTSGFFYKYSGLIYISSAGHCYNSSYPKWYEGTSSSGIYIGTNFGYSFYNGMSADVMLINQSSSAAKNLVYISDVEKSRVMTSWLANSSQTYGAVACRVGEYSGYTCGFINGTDLTETVNGNWTEYHMWEADFASYGGDSGGPILSGNAEMGVTDDTDGFNTYYSTIYWVDYVMGTTPCVSSSC